MLKLIICLINFIMMDNDRINRKENLLKAAEKLFAELGYDAVSTRAIAAKAGVNMAMLNYYFGSKDGLYKAIIEQSITEFHKKMGSREQNVPATERLFEFVENYADWSMPDNYLNRLMNRELTLQQRSDISEFILAGLLRTTNELKLIINDGIQEGSFRQVDTEMTCLSIFGTLNYLCNSIQTSSKLLNKNLNNADVVRGEIKDRMVVFLKDLLNAHLSINTQGI